MHIIDNETGIYISLHRQKIFLLSIGNQRKIIIKKKSHINIRSVRYLLLPTGQILFSIRRLSN